MSLLNHSQPGGKASFNAPATSAEKAKLSQNGRTTPESETAISSDDEHEATTSVNSQNSQRSVPPLRGPRRASWLSEIKPIFERKTSISGIPANGSQPPTPSSEPGGWGNTLTRIPSNNSATSTWIPGTGIWSNDALSPVVAPPLEDSPFGMHIVPSTPKTIRSQSYSVGQQEDDYSFSSTPLQNLARTRQVPLIKHKPSKLNEVEHASVLDEVHEGDDEGSDAGVSLGSSRLYNNHQHPHLPGPHLDGSSDGALLHRCFTLPSAAYSGQADTGAPQESSDGYAKDSQTFNTRVAALNQHANRPQWQSSLGFGHLNEAPESRRHSLAEVRTIHPSSIPKNVLSTNGPSTYTSTAASNQEQGNFRAMASEVEEQMAQSEAQHRAYASTYFSGGASIMRNQAESSGDITPHARGMGGPYRQGPPTGMWPRPGFDTPLYIVSFKCARADVYYVQQGTGLDVNEGDLVIVEADRGYDLGTVMHARVSWARARELKEKSADEHYRWLMMFSQHNRSLASTDPQGFHGLMASTGPQQRRKAAKSRPDIRGGDAGQDHELKPRMIKRRAFGYEIANLREKEGNEAKAKRTCQAKAREHGYHMEVLDAEFQIDWKKLTFYFYAEEFINFNHLVTDLYKIYKIRIWLSAINPDTYPSPPNKPPSSIGPGAIEGRDTPMDPNISGALASYHDPDPDGAIPPQLNPNSDTYKELNKSNELTGSSLSMQAMLPGSSNHDNVKFAQANTLTTQTYAANQYHQGTPWQPRGYGSPDPMSNENIHVTSTQATTGTAAFTPTVKAFTPQQPGRQALMPGVVGASPAWNSYQYAHSQRPLSGPVSPWGMMNNGSTTQPQSPWNDYPMATTRPNATIPTARPNPQTLLHEDEILAAMYRRMGVNDQNHGQHGQAGVFTNIDYQGHPGQVRPSERLESPTPNGSGQRARK